MGSVADSTTSSRDLAPLVRRGSLAVRAAEQEGGYTHASTGLHTPPTSEPPSVPRSLNPGVRVAVGDGVGLEREDLDASPPLRMFPARGSPRRASQGTPRAVRRRTYQRIYNGPDPLTCGVASDLQKC